ncbi:MAG TPA: hypothetical protein VLT32_09125 [Candidatus Sulfomarinibacteraceae bacterium]|nr:hypothetical protein [Candidatus Sulfomarinibacteraceae bacterium]
MRSFVCVVTVILIAGVATAQNEDCASASLIAAFPFNTSIDNSMATASPPPGSCNSSSATVMQNDVWYTFTINSTCDFTITVDPDAGTGYDGIVVLHSGSCASLSEVLCADDPEPQIMNIFGAAPGTYYLQAGDWGVSPGGGLTTIDIIEVVPGACGVVPVELMTIEVE